jgi:hypothetical protein
MIRRMIRAMMLESAFYEEVEADPRYNREAFLVVFVAALASGIGTATAYPGEGVLHFIQGLLATLFTWVAWAGITLWIGTSLTKGAETRSNMGEMLRALGYAHAPQVFILLVFLPGVGPLIALLASLWSLLAGIVAIRQALDFSTWRAVLTVFIGWILVVALRTLLTLLL